MRYFYILTLSTLVFFSCKKDTAVNSLTSSNYSYFPLEEGSWIIYNVDSVVHLSNDDGTNQPDTSIASYHFQIKEVVDFDFIDGQGNKAYRVSRYKRQNDTLPWDFLVVWISLRTSGSAQRVEENVRYIKLSFPINQKSMWNGNAYNDQLQEDYSYSEIHIPSTFGNNRFDSTVTVLQLDDDNLIHRVFKQEKYANHVGLVYKEKDSLNINSIGQVTNGFEFRETIQSYSH